MVYLAMTAAEFRNRSSLPDKIAWMACHFSPYGTGLTNLPTELPPDSLLILNDRTSIQGHDPTQILESIRNTVERFHCSGVLLDLQRRSDEAASIIERLLTLPCPVAVSQQFAENLDCPIFLPPVPILTPVSQYLAQWKGRQIWLELALDSARITVTESGSQIDVQPPGCFFHCRHYSEELQLHYQSRIGTDRIEFTLQRTKADLDALLVEAQAFGVTNAIGLYQELGTELCQ